MQTVRTDEAGLAAAARVLLRGGVAVIPTDTVYGLAAHPDFPEAVERLYEIKRRAAKKPIALLANDAEGAAKFLGGMDAQATRIVKKHWPGALTLVLPKGDGFEGLRVPDHGWTRRLLAACGGVLRVTSANLSGQRAATDAPEALASIGLSADLVVDDGISPGGVASTVAKVADGEITVLRPGPVRFLTLASGSPRRAKILRQHDVDFVVVKSDAPEVCYPDDPERTVRENALAKGQAIGSMPFEPGRARTPTAPQGVLSADTIVWFNNKIYGKPRDLEEARAFLRELSGNVHTVFTGVAYDGDVKICRSDVRFRVLTDAMIDEYVARVKPTDRAGAYDIDESGDYIVEGYAGSYENIMGLPVEPLTEWGIARPPLRPLRGGGEKVVLGHN